MLTAGGNNRKHIENTDYFEAVTMPDRSVQTKVINFRASEDQKALIERAAKRLGKSRTDFILDTMREASENVLLDQYLFGVDESVFRTVEAALDAPPKLNENLRRTLMTVVPWEKYSPGRD